MGEVSAVTEHVLMRVANAAVLPTHNQCATTPGHVPLVSCSPRADAEDGATTPGASAGTLSRRTHDLHTIWVHTRLCVRRCVPHKRAVRLVGATRLCRGVPHAPGPLPADE